MRGTSRNFGKPLEQRGGHGERIEGSGPKFGAVPTPKNQRLFPDLRAKRLQVKHAGALMQQKELVDQLNLAPRRLKSEVQKVALISPESVGISRPLAPIAQPPLQASP